MKAAKTPRRIAMKDGRKVKTIRIRLDPTAPSSVRQVRDLLQRSGVEYLRHQGKYRQLVLSQLHEGRDPFPQDVAAALREPVPDGDNVTIRAKHASDTARLLEYVASTFVLGKAKRKPGRKKGARTLSVASEGRAAADYFAAIENLTMARDRNSRLPRPIKARALRKVAAEYGIGEDTLRAIIRHSRPIFFRE